MLLQMSLRPFQSSDACTKHDTCHVLRDQRRSLHHMHAQIIQPAERKDDLEIHPCTKSRFTKAHTIDGCLPVPWESFLIEMKHFCQTHACLSSSILHTPLGIGRSHLERYLALPLVCEALLGTGGIISVLGKNESPADLSLRNATLEIHIIERNVDTSNHKHVA